MKIWMTSNSNTRQVAVTAVWYLVLLVSVAAHALPRHVKDVRYAMQGDRTRVVIDCSSSFAYEAVPFHEPERVAINFRGVKKGPQAEDFKINDGIVRGIRINQLSWGTQVVLDLEENTTWKPFTLAKAKGKSHRVVVDVTRISKNTVVQARAPVQTKEAVAAKEPLPAVETPKYCLVAIDAGHGGRDPGAKGRYHIVEKNVTLDIAKRVEKMLNKRPGFKAFLIRKNDIYISLPDRTQIAKHKGADAFVSIHLNTAKSKKARGSEVFFLSPGGAAAKTTQLLNDTGEAAEELGVNEPENDELLYMLLDVNQQATMLKSSILAEKILKSMKRKGLPPTRGIKQRSFGVLKSITMPSVIVEAGFISNAYDAKIVKSSAGRENIAEAVANGVVSFFKKYPPSKRGITRTVVHKVHKGDTLWKIAKKYDVSVQRIKSVNKLGKSNRIHVGQELIIMF